MRAVSNNTGYSTPLAPVGTGMNGGSKQTVSAEFDKETPSNSLQKRSFRAASLRDSSRLDPDMVSTLLQTQEFVESEVSRFLNARRKIGGILKSIIEPFDRTEEETASNPDQETESF